jgi:hypothetical protein
MELIACESNMTSHLWKVNVAKEGILRTVSGLFWLFNMNIVDEGGQ